MAGRAGNRIRVGVGAAVAVQAETGAVAVRTSTAGAAASAQRRRAGFLVARCLPRAALPAMADRSPGRPTPTRFGRAPYRELAHETNSGPARAGPLLQAAGLPLTVVPCGQVGCAASDAAARAVHGRPCLQRRAS
jgi:hypothetical protein